MKIDRINSMPFTSGSLKVYNTKNSKFEKLDASDIYEIRYNRVEDAVSLTVPDYDKNFDAPRHTQYIRTIQLQKTIPVEMVLAAYTAAMAAPSRTAINVL